MYKVLRRFTDLQDNRYLYQPGDEYPRAGLDVSEDRIDELSSSNNRRHVALIKFIPRETDTTEEVEEIDTTEKVEEIEQTEPEHIENMLETSSEDPEETEVIETKPKRKRAKKEQ